MLGCSGLHGEAEWDDCGRGAVSGARAGRKTNRVVLRPSVSGRHGSCL